MGRAKTKKELILGAHDNYKKLEALMLSLSDIERNTQFDFSKDEKKKEAHWKRDKNIKDVLVHLYEWHQLLIGWIKSNQAGISKHFLSKPYTWKTYGDLNMLFWEKHQDTTYEEAQKMLSKSHCDAMDIINLFSDAELFTKDVFSWTGTTTLGSYCVSATASHYEWAIKKIKAHVKNC